MSEVAALRRQRAEASENLAEVVAALQRLAG
jgi:hypothetical protein